ncbi:MAG: TetR/AcrR family transcriptional regulator [Clostridiales bacterium]|nr:TetR/AcrR family transcriptional regulator [Clostridiales bacterium]
MNMTHDKRFIRGNQTLQTLIEVGKALWVSQENISEITLDEICCRCEMTKGAFYHHFASKDAFFEQISSCVLAEHMVSVISSSDEKYPDQPDKQISAWIRGIADYSAHYRSNIRYFSKISQLDNRRQTISSWRSTVHEHLTRWQEQGLVRNDISAQALQDYLDSFTYGTYLLTAYQYIEHPHQDELINSFVQTLLIK